MPRQPIEEFPIELEEIEEFPSEEVPTATPSAPSSKGFLRRTIDWLTTPLIGPDMPTAEEVETMTPQQFGERSQRALWASLTTPLSIIGEIAAPVIGGIAAVRQAAKLRGLKAIPTAEEVAQLNKALRDAILESPVGQRAELPPPSYRFEAGPSSLILEKPRSGLPQSAVRDLHAPVVAAAPSASSAPSASPAPLPNPIQKLLAAVRESKPLTKKQAELYTKERIERLEELRKRYNIPGIEGHFARKGALAGEYGKVVREPLKLDDTDVTQLFNMIRDNPAFLDFEKIHAGDGLARLLRGQVPREHEINILEDMFGSDVISEIVAELPKIKRRGGLISETVNLTRALLASMDLSAPFRQGLPLLHHKAWWTSWDDMVRSFASEKAYAGVMQGIREGKYFTRKVTEDGQVLPSLAEQAGLKLTDLRSFSRREEAIMSTWAERIPLIGRGVRASNRAYTAFLNKLRADTFTSLVDDAIRVAAGDSRLDPRSNLHLARSIASYVNNASGRGDLGKLERSAVALNNIFFAPRNIASRVQMLNPANYLMTPPPVRRQYLKSLLSVAAFWGTMAKLGEMAGAEVSLDPTSSDFGKIKIGNVRLDPAGSFQQYLVVAYRLLRGQFTGATRPGVTYQTGAYFGRPTRKDILESFLTSKLNPLLGFAYDLLAASRYRPFNLADQTAQLFIPMVVQDIIEIAKEDPALIPWLGPLIYTGLGSQVFSRARSQSLLFGSDGVF